MRRRDLGLLLREASSAGRRTRRWRARIDSSRDLADVLAADLDRQRLRLQAVAVAGFAGVGGLVARRVPRASSRCRFRCQRRVEVADDALERLCTSCRSARRRRSVNSISSSPEPYRIASCTCFGQLLPRRRHRNLVVLGEAFERLLVVGRGRAGFRPGHRRRPPAARASSSGTTSSASNCSSVPRPSQAGRRRTGR